MEIFGLWDWIGDAIFSAVLKIIWLIVIQGPLLLINAFDSVFRFLTGGIFYDVLFGGKQFDLDKIPAGFYIFCAVAIFVAVMIFIIQYLTLMMVDEGNLKDRLVKSLKSSFKGILFTVIIPIGFFLTCVFLEFMQKVIMATFGGANNNFAKMLYKLGDPSWDGQDLDSGIKANFAAPDNILEYNFIVEIAGVWMMGYTIIMVGVAVSSKIFELYILFIIGPFFAATMPNDDGVRMKQWRDSSMGKMLVTLGSFLVYSVFIVLMSYLTKIVYDKFSDEVARMLLIIILLIGGGIFVQNMPSFFASFLNDQVGAAEGRAGLRGMFAAGGMLKAGGLGLLSAVGIGKAARKRKEEKNKSRLSKFNAKMNPFGSSQSGNGGDGNSNNNHGSFDDDSTQPAPNVAMAMRGVGALGAGGSILRTTASVAGAGVTLGATIGAAFGNKRGKERVKQAWNGRMTGISNKARLGWTKFSSSFKSNTAGHVNQTNTFDANRKEDKYLASRDRFISKQDKKIMARKKILKNPNLTQKEHDFHKVKLGKEVNKKWKTVIKYNDINRSHNKSVGKRNKKIDLKNANKNQLENDIRAYHTPYQYDPNAKKKKNNQKKE